ncbi:MFS transporter [Arthrobacter rhombi]|uniref:MFS transporter n=1 Tax=Arthrobacter rhombi TaxID=71253 RepID=UPI003FD6A7AA
MSQNLGTAPVPSVPRNHQRRVVLCLSLAQLFSGLGNGSALALGSLMAVDLTGSNAYAGATTMAISVAGALTALPLAGLAIRRGRRVALSAGMLIAAVGALGMLLTPILESFPLLLVSAALLGVGNAANLQARFAATDLAEPATRGRDLGLVV